MAATPSFIAIPKTPAATFANGDGTTFKALMTGGALGSRADCLFCSNTDPANANVIQLALQVSGVDYVIGESAVPAGSGTNGSAKSVSLLNPIDIPGLSYTEAGALFLAAGVVLRARCKTAMAGSSTMQIVGVAGDY